MKTLITKHRITLSQDRVRVTLFLLLLSSFTLPLASFFCCCSFEPVKKQKHTKQQKKAGIQ